MRTIFDTNPLEHDRLECAYEATGSLRLFLEWIQNGDIVWDTGLGAELVEDARKAETCLESLFPSYDRLNPHLEKDKQEIARLRALPYDDYLQTDWWRGVRDRALRWAEHRCQVCYADDSLHVHHRTYERRGYEALSDVIVLCNVCHALFHERIKLQRATGPIEIRTIPL